MGALDVVLPAEHLVDDVHVAEQVGDDLMVGLALDVVEQHRTAAVHVLLQAGDLEVGVDLLLGLDEVTLFPQPFQGGAQVAGVHFALRCGLWLRGRDFRGLFLARRLLHFVALLETDFAAI